MNNYKARFDEFLSILPSVMKSVGFELQGEVVKQIGKQFRKDDGKVFNTTDKLRKKSGGLLNSYIDKNEDSISVIAFDNGELKFQIGSKKKYANIQEEGGFVKSQGNMHSYFWAKYYETKNEQYKIIALSVKKKGGINIKGKHYFAKAMQEFSANVYPKFAAKSAANLLNAWKGTE